MGALSLSGISYAILAGLIPPLIWLYFLLREDARSPEPKGLIFLAFLTGMLAVPFVIPIESFTMNYALTHFPACQTGSGSCVPIIIAWATAEEVVKYLLAALLILWRRDVDESIDLVIYMLTVALGFAALENTLFLITPFTDGNLGSAFITDNLRFVGSTLLHVVASSAIGFSLAFTFKAPRLVRAGAATIGLILAIGLHTLFNFFIIDQNGGETITAFFIVWTGALIFFALFELLKYFQYRKLPASSC